METIILVSAFFCVLSAVSFACAWLDEIVNKKEMQKEMDAYPLLSDEEYEQCIQHSEGCDQEFHRLATFYSKVKQVEMNYQWSLSTQPKLHYKMALRFLKWGKEWDKEHAE